MMMYDDIFSWEGWGGELRLASGECRLRIYATNVTRQFNIKPHRMLFIEYYPETAYGERNEHIISEKYDVVDFTWHEDRAIEPKWRTLKPPLLDEIKKIVEKH
jgi:hypothetical protein